MLNFDEFSGGIERVCFLEGGCFISTSIDNSC